MRNREIYNRFDALNNRVDALELADIKRYWTKKTPLSDLTVNITAKVDYSEVIDQLKKLIEVLESLNQPEKEN